MQTEQLQQIELEYRKGTSDKVYRAAIEEANGGFVVNFAYGRRGATLNTGSKTAHPVTLAEATSVYEKLVRSKTAKGYKPVGGGGGGGIGSSVTDRDRRDTGLRPQLLNPITEEDALVYLDNDRWAAQEKYDGRRMMIRKTGSAIVATNRDGLVVGFPDAVARVLASISGSFVLDGECVGETFYAFDLLEHGRDLRGEPYRDRLAGLTVLLGPLDGAVQIARTVTGVNKRLFMAELKATQKEGVVYKDLDAIWYAGRPASGGRALKCKFWASCSCVVTKVNGRRSVGLALGGKSVGNVTIPPNHRIPPVGSVVEVRYLYVSGVGGSLYQPIYLGERDDVPAAHCTPERQRLKFKPTAL
jgi:bifunctional non-homologous end joining protein LigD